MDEEDTEEEEEGSDEEREVTPQLAEEDKQGGEARDLDVSSGGVGLAVGVDKAMLRPAPWGVHGLDAGRVGLI